MNKSAAPFGFNPIKVKKLQQKTTLDKTHGQNQKFMGSSDAGHFTLQPTNSMLTSGAPPNNYI
jgi:hypothetical protein